MKNILSFMLFSALMVAAIPAISQQKAKWKEMEEFHEVMS
jgi:hypothetical protein